MCAFLKDIFSHYLALSLSTSPCLHLTISMMFSDVLLLAKCIISFLSLFFYSVGVFFFCYIALSVIWSVSVPLLLLYHYLFFNSFLFSGSSSIAGFHFPLPDTHPFPYPAISRPSLIPPTSLFFFFSAVSLSGFEILPLSPLFLCFC